MELFFVKKKNNGFQPFNYFRLVVGRGSKYTSERVQQFSLFSFFFYPGFFNEYSRFTGQQGEGEPISFISSVLLPPTSQTLRHQPGDYSRELTSSHSQQLDSNRELLVAERKSLSTKYAPLNLCVAILQLKLK